MSKLIVFGLIASIALLLAAGDALAKGGKGGGQCKPGLTFQDCYDKCLRRVGADGVLDMNKCSKKCSKKVCA